MKYTLNPSRFRLAVQAAFTLYCLYVGYRFAGFVAWATGASDVFTPKPGAVEGFLPISALMGYRQLLLTGQWDTVHPAGLTIFIAVLVMAFLFRKGFCGYICPVGFVSNLLDRAGRRLRLSLVPPRWLDLPLSALKYILLGGFCYAIFSMGLKSLSAFINSPFNVVSDGSMLAFFLHPSPIALAVFAALAALGLVFRHFWCRYLCPYGALLGLLSWFGPLAVRRDADLCVHCNRCADHCPSGIDVVKKTVVRSPECLGCGECVSACPVKGCLDFTVYGKRRVPWAAVGLGAAAVLLLAWLWASATGHWDATMPPEMLKRFYATVLGG